MRLGTRQSQLLQPSRKNPINRLASSSPVVANNVGNVINLQFGDEIYRPFIVISNIGDGLWHWLYHLSGSWNLSDFESERARSPAVSTPQPRSKAPLPTGKIALETSMEPLKGIALDDDGPFFIYPFSEKLPLEGHIRPPSSLVSAAAPPLPEAPFTSGKRSGRCNTTGCGKMGIAQPPWVKKGQDGSCQTVKPGNMCVFSQAQSWVNDPGWQVPRSEFLHSWVTNNRASYMKKHWDINKKVFRPNPEDMVDLPSGKLT